MLQESLPATDPPTRACLAWALLAGLFSCAQSLGAQEPRPAAEWQVSQEPLLVVGDGDQFFEAIAQVLPASGGMIVADGGLQNIRAFDDSGALEWSVGREGDGPGEFRFIAGMWWRNDSTLGIWDGRAQRLTFLGLEGADVETERPEGAGAANYNAYMGSLADDRILVAALSWDEEARYSTTPVPDEWSVVLFAGDGAFLGEVVVLRGMRRIARFPTAYTPMAYVAVHGDTLFTIDDRGSAIAVRNLSGDVVRTLEVDLARSSDRDPASSLRSELERGGKALYLENLDRHGSPDPASVPLVGGLLAGADGLLWVKAFSVPHDSVWLRRRSQRPAGGGVWWVIDGRGKTVGRVEMPDDFTPLHVSDDILAGVTIDDLGVERAALYRLNR